MEFSPVRKDIASKSVILSQHDNTHTFKMKIWTNKTIKHQIYMNEDFSLHYPSPKKGSALARSTQSEMTRARTNFQQDVRQQIKECVYYM